MTPQAPTALIMPLARVIAPLLSPLARPRIRAAAWGVAALWLYTDLAHDWVGVPTRSSQLYLELPLVALWYALSYWSLRPGPFPAVLAGLPILELYFLHDAYYAVFGRVMRVVDFRLLAPLAEVMDGIHLALLLAAIIVPIGLYLWRLDWRRWTRPLAWFCAVITLWTLPLWVPAAPMHLVGGAGPVLVPFSDLRNVENHGRISMLLRLESQRQQLLVRLTHILSQRK